KLTELRRLWDAGEGIFTGDLGERKRRVHESTDAVGGEVAGVGAGGALSEEDAHADGLGAGFLQRFAFAESNYGGELAAVHGNSFGFGCPILNGAAHDVRGNFRQVVGSRWRKDCCSLDVVG